jgi:glycosyltransferase involved in cell wall biosynthesis
LDALLQCLAQFSEREKFHLHVYGELLESKSVQAQIRQLLLKQLVTLHGFMPEKELDRALDGAHLAINLRFPTMGEASASQLRIWAHALPSLVTQVGWYAQLPPNAVAHVRPAHEIEDIEKHLRDFLSDPARFAKMGESGRRILEQDHSPDVYAQGIVELAIKAQEFRTRAASYKLAERAGALMSDCGLDIANTDRMQTKIATEILALTLGEQSSKR